MTRYTVPADVSLHINSFFFEDQCHAPRWLTWITMTFSTFLQLENKLYGSNVHDKLWILFHLIFFKKSFVSSGIKEADFHSA